MNLNSAYMAPELHVLRRAVALTYRAAMTEGRRRRSTSARTLRRGCGSTRRLVRRMSPIITGFRRFAFAVLCLAVAPPGQAAELRAGLAFAPSSVDPHFFNGLANKALAIHIFDRLVEQTPDLRLAPGLAMSWRTIGDTVWEFTLRPGVKWHDGQDFTADDVVFSLERAPNVPNSPGGFGTMVRAIKRIEVTGPLGLRLHTAGPAPNLPGDLANVAIVSRHAGQGATTADYNSGKAAIGTGPYKLERYVSGDHVELARNDAWWSAKPEWERVSFRMIPNQAARTAALLAGDVDLIDAPAPADLSRIKTAGAQVFSVGGTRTVYLSPDFSRRESTPFVTDAEGKLLSPNPLLDLRIRQALSLAINRKALTERVMQGAAEPTGQWMWPGAYSYGRDIAVPRYDPERAKALLAEAGLPKGFRLTLHTYSDRGDYAAAAQGIAQMWTRIGVQTAVEGFAGPVYASRGIRHDFSMSMWSWGSNSGEAGYLLINVLGTPDPVAGRGASNNSGYANAVLDTLTDKALATLDDRERERLLIDAQTKAVDDLAMIPLYQLINLWAARKGLTYDARPDERTIAMSAHSAK
jgi:peptide/nickel transport system substrate-binding protein